MIDKGMQNCTIKQISDSSLNNKQHGFYSMKNPLELFSLNRTYTFVGQVCNKFTYIVILWQCLFLQQFSTNCCKNSRESYSYNK